MQIERVEFLRLLRPCFTHMETAAFARIETHVYDAVPVKVELNEVDKDLVGKEEDLSTDKEG